MKRKIAIIIYIISIIITVSILCNLIINYNLLSKYNKGQYLEEQGKLLTDMSFQKNYVANYNYGNILYQNGKYKNAITEYEKALKTVISSKRECSIRINYALALCKTVNLDESDEESISNAIEIYEKAITVLSEKDCDKHDQDAKTLKKDIQNEIDRLKQKQNTEEEKENNNDDNREDKKNSQSKDDIEEKIQKVKEEAIKDQKETEGIYKNFNKSFTKIDKNW